MRIMIKSMLFAVVTFFVGCITHKSLREDDFIGTWKSDDNSKIILYENGKCELFNFNYKKVNSIATNNPIVSGEGLWKFEQGNGKNQIVITYYDGTTFQYLNKTVRSNFNIDFQIEGIGMLGQPPWYLYVSIGDPDDLNKYIFNKVEVAR